MCKRSLLVMFAFALFSAPVCFGAPIVLDDFSTNATVPAGGLPYSAIDQNWYEKVTDQCIIEDGVLKNISKSGTASRFGAVFSLNAPGSDWTFEFDLTGPLNRLMVWVGKDNGNNQPTDTVMTFTGDGGLNDAIVDGSWVSVIDTGNGATFNQGTNSYAIGEDLSGYDLIAIRYRVTTAGGTYDNVQLTPEPATLALLGIGGLMVASKRRRKA